MNDTQKLIVETLTSLGAKEKPITIDELVENSNLILNGSLMADLMLLEMSENVRRHPDINYNHSYMVLKEQ